MGEPTVSPRILEWATSSFVAEIEAGCPTLSSTRQCIAAAQVLNEMRDEGVGLLDLAIARVYSTWAPDDLDDSARALSEAFHARYAERYTEIPIFTPGRLRTISKSKARKIALPLFERRLGKKHKRGWRGSRVWTLEDGPYKIETAVFFDNMPRETFSYEHRYPAVGRYYGLSEFGILLAWGFGTRSGWMSFDDDECAQQAGVALEGVLSFLEAKAWRSDKEREKGD